MGTLKTSLFIIIIIIIIMSIYSYSFIIEKAFELLIHQSSPLWKVTVFGKSMDPCVSGNGKNWIYWHDVKGLPYV